ncbi:MAG: hypothetical protein WA728_03475, partial [Xanthobacteraceae bacterium]
LYDRDVCFWHKADIPIALLDVRFWGQSGHRAAALQCPLMTHSGHDVAESLPQRNMAGITRR